MKYKDISGFYPEFTTILAAIPGTKEGKQEWLRARLGADRIARTSHDHMWQSMVREAGAVAAAEAVFVMVRIAATERVEEALAAAAAGEPVQHRSGDPVLLRRLFFTNGKPRKVGQLLLDHLDAADQQGDEGKRKPSGGKDMSKARSPTATPARPSPADAADRASKPARTFEYDAALSFAGEDRAHAEALARLPAQGFR